MLIATISKLIMFQF